jgi:DNA topoisomerase-1
MTLEAYCVKCKTKREIANPQAGWTTRGTPRVTGTCPVCGTNLFRMGATEAHASLSKPEIVPVEKASAKKKTKAKTTKKSGKSATGKKVATRGTTKTAARTAASASASKKAAAKSDKKAPAKSTSVGKLVIVESPAKARSVGQFLGKGYTVKASKGHVRDLLVSQLSVDVENDFEPKYRVINDKRETVKDLQSAVERATEIYLATDPDREGEAIAWHLLSAVELDHQPSAGVKRVVFHEITKPAIQEAFSHPREIDMNLVNAQQARRILDRLVGYQVTELLWEKVRNRLSAGRVQSIAVRLIVDREREIEAFVQQEYWTLDAQLSKAHTTKSNGKNKPFLARLFKIGNTDVDFRASGDVQPHLAILEKSQFGVVDVKTGERVRKPSAPFTTSTLQQEASRRLGFTAKRTMAVAQQLYEGIEIGAEGSVGLITYMRTDSLSISPQAQKEARAYIEERFGKDFMPSRAPVYKTKAKGAQEAHEAIRPTGVTHEPDALKKMLSSDQYRLYNLIWHRFVASQMANAIYNTLRVDIDAGLTAKERPYHFRVSGSTIRFSGFLALYEDAHDEDIATDEDEGRILPEMAIGELLDLLGLQPEQHFTQPPPRYTEASIVRTLEEFGIGRPSTYAPTVAVIQDREYVTKQDKRMIPTDTGKIVNDLLVEHFPEIMDFQFTAKMENELDDVSEGHREWRPVLRSFYEPFERELKTAHLMITPINHVEEIGRACPVCGKPLVIRYGRFGKFIGCSDYPECRHTEPFLERLGIACPLCGAEHGGEIIERRSKRGRVFYGCLRYPECEFTSWQKPMPQPCPNCGGLLVEQSRSKAQCTNCKQTFQMDKLVVESAEPV